MGRPIFSSPDDAARLLGAAGPARPDHDDLRGRQPRAVRHGLQVLECVAAAGAGITAQEISTALGLSRATTYRLVQVLVEDEYLVRLPDLRGFALGRRVAALAPAPPPRPPRAAREVLARVRAGTRGGIHLVHLDAAVPVVVDEDPDFPLVAGPGVRDLLDAVCGELAGGQGAVQRSTDEWIASGHTVDDESGRPVAALVMLALANRMPDPGETAAALRTAAERLGPLLA
ncbi:transcriptional regulator, IclR family [Xylanimonas cellulosilytica DSM 15894]|uniref:Transcriptional regulator, IclR family n=1 Tax=Xylanimonas cellulosilytica (strain DSM 15894 / JCM 12276 / CECT 5975 / KCTC 9989 / LMG 20990 / NBRC 107835 / XIL07) TaxID=446471 RepID=D1BZU3_XYLCX|nr:helix-turn-helix domain-containing protein [Xylanimonas cellulosilytica]ACZ32071.1 transcriptional regulator, IclR family [Xylanimonas cellulosilytica DSM 15894]